MTQTHLKYLAILMLVPLSVASAGVFAAAKAPTASAKPAAADALTPPQVTYHEGLLSIDANKIALSTVLKLVTEQTQVKFNVTRDDLKASAVSVKIENRPYEEAIRLLLVDYNTLHVWNEQMKLLEVNVIGKAEGKDVPIVAKTDKDAGKGANKHPHSHTPPDQAKIESALKDLGSDDPGQRQAALDELIGGADARIAPAMLELALTQPAENSPGNQSGGANGNPANAGGDDTAMRASMSLWRHGLERGFVDSETIGALRTLQEKGSPSASGIASQALEDMQAHF